MNSDIVIDFVGVKIGDVNGSVIANANSTSIDKRSNGQLSFYMEEQSLTAGETYKLNVLSDTYDNILGWQTTLRFDNTAIEVMDMTPGVLDVQKSKNTNFMRSQEGMIAVSYNSDNAVSLSDNMILMEITVTALRDISTSDIFEMTSDMTKTEAYNESGELLDIRWKSQLIKTASIVSVSPNPWSEKTSIEIEMPFDGDAQWEFYNVDGKLLYTRSEYYSAGVHKLTVRRENINSSGIIYAKLITESGIAEYKMIVL